MKKIYFVFLLFVAILGAADAQRMVKGTILDKDGGPVIGANVVAKGTNVGTISDQDGKYTISVPEGANTLVFSYTGYTTQEISIGASNMIDVTLTEGILLQETVISALGVKRNKSDVVYANQTVGNEELNSVTNKSVLNALQGKVAGVKINQSSGAIGASTRVVLRGETSLTQGNNALIVVDGVQMNNSTTFGGGGTGKTGDRDNYVDFGNRGNDINPDDIESVTVLKGPAATTLYGSRGGSGVILITTKKGQSGRPRISFSSSYSAEKAYLVMKQQQQYGSGYGSCAGCGGGISIFMGENFAWGPKFDGVVRPWTGAPADDHDELIPLNNGKIEQLARPYSAVENNLQNFFDIGNTRRINFGIDGGNDKFTYYMSYTNYDQSGIVAYTNLNKHNFLFNTTAKFTDRLRATFNFNYTKLKQRGNTEGGYPFGYTTGTPAYGFALQTPPNIPFFELRNYNSPYHDLKGFYGQYSINPYFILGEQQIVNNVDNVISSIGLTYNLFRNFDLTGRISTNFSISGVTEKSPKFSYERALSYSDGELSDFGSPRNNFSLGAYKESSVRRTDLMYDLFGTYSWKIADFVDVTSTLGFNSIEEQARNVVGSTVGGLVIPGFYDLTNSVQNPISTADSYKYRLFGVYFNSYFSMLNKMLNLEYSARNDWSSTLPSGNRDFFYQAGGISFVPTNGNILEPNDIINFLKVRANIGTSGKDAPRYRLETYYDLNPIVLDFGDDFRVRFPFNEVPGAQKLNQIGNPDLKPELSTTAEFGIDLGLFNDRLGLEYTYYVINSTNQIVDVNIPWSSGYRVLPLNIGEMENKGHELVARLKLVKNKWINWDVFGSYSRNRNLVKTIIENDVNNDELNIYTGLVHFAGHGSMNLVAAEGQPFGTFKGTGFVYRDGKVVVDATGNPIQDPNLTYLGNYQPDFLANWGTNIRVKGFTISTLFDMRKGGLFFSGSQLSTEFNGTASTTLLNNRENFIVDNSILFENGEYKTNNIETQAYAYFRALPASHNLIDASFIKLRELSIAYDFPTCKIGNATFNNVRLSVFGRNLKYWLPEENTFADPEVSGVGANSDAAGIESSTTPSARSFGAELRITF